MPVKTAPAKKPMAPKKVPSTKPRSRTQADVSALHESRRAAALKGAATRKANMQAAAAAALGATFSSDPITPPPWERWGQLPANPASDLSGYRVPPADSPEMMEALEWMRANWNHPSYKDEIHRVLTARNATVMMGKIDVPEPVTPSRTGALLKEYAEAATPPPPGQFTPQLDPIYRDMKAMAQRYISEPPRLYVLSQDRGSDHEEVIWVLANDLVSESTPQKWTDDLSKARLFGARQAADHLALVRSKLAKALAEAGQEQRLVIADNYVVVPADVLLFRIQQAGVRDEDLIFQ